MTVTSLGPRLCGPYSRSLAAALALCAPLAIAHHSDASYDRDTVVAFEGQVVSYTWRNPHVQVFVETANDAGERVEWEIETGSTPIMMRSGWTRELLSPGDTITVRLHPERGTGRARGILNVLETADGRLWSQVETDPEATVAATNLNGVWKGLSSSSLNRQLNQAALTPAAQAARASYDDLEHRTTAACLPNPPPMHIASPVYLSQIELLEDRAILRNEIFDVTRTVHMDGREHPENGERTNQGHSIGWWEDDTLVVDTRLLADHPSGNGRGVPSGPRKHLVERYRLSEDGTRALVDILIEDPDYLAEPFSGQIEMIYQPHLTLYRYDCDPEAMRVR
ncbi:MAG TPA: DUF6152 family protein [Gammaproteobacteria bacterium]|nr:DUF6152 family protein [Gammaproteobacteria bacterium]